MNRSSWKAAERRIAGLIGGRRVPVSGRSRGDAPDIEHPLLSVECKARKRLPDWLHEGMRQAVAATRGDQTPIVILHEAGRRYRDALCLVRLSDLERLGLLASAEESGGAGSVYDGTSGVARRRATPRRDGASVRLR
jgi:hypothetical protein